MRVAFRLALIQLTIMQLPPTPFSLVYLFFIFIFLLIYFFQTYSTSSFYPQLFMYLFSLSSCFETCKDTLTKWVVLMVDSALRLFRVRGLCSRILCNSRTCSLNRSLVSVSYCLSFPLLASILPLSTTNMRSEKILRQESETRKQTENNEYTIENRSYQKSEKSKSLAVDWRIASQRASRNNNQNSTNRFG